MAELTAIGVKNAKPGRHADGKGLYLLVKPSGARSWVLRVQVAGGRRDYGLGSVSFDPPSKLVETIPLGQRRILSLQEARAKAAQGLALAKAGRDPSVERAKMGEPEALVPTLIFKRAAERQRRLVKFKIEVPKSLAQWFGEMACQRDVVHRMANSDWKLADPPLADQCWRKTNRGKGRPRLSLHQLALRVEKDGSVISIVPRHKRRVKRRFDEWRASIPPDKAS